MRAFALALLVLLALALASGVAVVAVKLTAAQRRVRQAFRAAAGRHGLSRDWLDALAGTETVWRPATNRAGADGARGGAYGPSQITERTARAFGYSGPMDRLNSDVAAAADLTARMVAAGFAERGGKTYRFGRPVSAAQMFAVWNAGRLPTDPALPASTRDVYLSRGEAYLARVQEDGAALDGGALT